MKYIKNLENKTQSVLTENIADDAAEISGLDKDAVADAIKGLNFSNYLELGNAVTVEDGETIREILNISDIVPDDPMGEIDLDEADNPSAPAVASPSAPAVTPPSAGSSINALAQPADTATDVDNQEVQQGRKEVDDLQIGDEIEVADIDGQPAAGRIRNLAGPGDTFIITGKGNEEHMIRKDSILSTPLLPVQTSDGEVIEGLKEQYESALAEKGRQTRLKNTTKLGSKNRRAERLEKKRKLDVDENEVKGVNDKYDDETLECKHCGDYFCTSKFGGECPEIQRDMFDEGYGEETYAEMVDYWKQNLSSYIVSKKVFTQLYTAANNDIDELNAAIADQAESIASSYHGSGEGIGSSDVNHFIAHIGSSLGIEDLFGWNKPSKARFDPMKSDEEMTRDKTNRASKFRKVNEGIGFHFYVEPQEVGALVMSSKGDIHDFYEDETEARRVAEQLNAQYGKVDEDLARMRELAGIKETASGGATGAGAIASSPSAMNGVQKRNPSIYGQTKLKKKPTPKTRITKEDSSEGIGRSKKE